MDCPNEFTLAMYADGELPEAESWELRGHLTECEKCRELSAALQEENRALVHALQHLDAPAPAQVPMGRAQIAELSAIVFGAAFAIRIAQDYLTGQEAPVSLEWLSPFHLEGQLNLLLTSIVYLFSEGGPKVISVISSLSVAAAAAFILLTVPRLIRRSTSAGLLLGPVLVLLFCSMPAQAIDHRTGGKGNESVVVAAGETIDDTLIAAGDSVIVEGTVNGDVIAVGRSVEIRGKVQGNLIAFAQNVLVEGTVGGTAYTFAQNVRIRGEVARDLYGFAQSVALDADGQVGRNIIAFVQALTIDGNARLDVVAFAQKVEAHGNIARDLSAHAEQVTLRAPTRVARDLVAEVPGNENLKIENGASIGGKKDVRITPPRQSPSRYTTAWFYLGQIFWFIAAFITGVLLFWLFPFLNQPPLTTREDLLKSGVIGFLAAVATPVAAVIVAITIIGLPIGLVSFTSWLLGLYLAKIVVAAFIGRSLLASPATSFPIALAAGLALVLIATDLPYVGGLVNILITFIGLGAIILEVFRRATRPAGSPALT